MCSGLGLYEKELERGDGGGPELDTNSGIVGQRGSKVSRQVVMEVQSAACGVTVVAVELASWRVPAGQRVLCR